MLIDVCIFQLLESEIKVKLIISAPPMTVLLDKLLLLPL